MDAAARARRQRGVGLRFAVEVEPHRKHDARAAVAEDDLGRLPRVHRAQHRPRLPGLHLLRGVRLLTTGLFPALPFGAVLLCARPGLLQLPRLPGLYLPEPRQPGLGASGFADGAGRGGARMRVLWRAGAHFRSLSGGMASSRRNGRGEPARMRGRIP